MARLSALLVLVGLLGTATVTASPQNNTDSSSNPDCDFGCVFNAFQENPCMMHCACTRGIYIAGDTMDPFLCCLAKGCNAWDLDLKSHDLDRLADECNFGNISFTFDREVFCYDFDDEYSSSSTSSALPASVASTATGVSISLAATTSTSAATSTITSGDSATVISGTSSTKTQTRSNGSTPTPTANSAPAKSLQMLKVVVVLIAAFGMLY